MDLFYMIKWDFDLTSFNWITCSWVKGQCFYLWSCCWSLFFLVQVFFDVIIRWCFNVTGESLVDGLILVHCKVTSSESLALVTCFNWYLVLSLMFLYMFILIVVAVWIVLQCIASVINQGVWVPDWSSGA